MGAYPVPVDVERLVIAFVLTDPGVQQVFGDKVGASKRSEYPCAALHRFGGAAARKGWLDRARIQCDVWGETKRAARDAAGTLYAAILGLEEAPLQPLGVVTGVEDLLGLSWLPDREAEARPRYLFQQIVTVHPHKP